MPRINGIRVVVNTELLEDGQAVVVRRTWKERICSKPWQPWISVKITRIKVPSKKALVANGCIVVHPEMLQRLREHLRESDSAVSLCRQIPMRTTMYLG